MSINSEQITASLDAAARIEGYVKTICQQVRVRTRPAPHSLQRANIEAEGLLAVNEQQRANFDCCVEQFEKKLDALKGATNPRDDVRFIDAASEFAGAVNALCRALPDKTWGFVMDAPVLEGATGAGDNGTYASTVTRIAEAKFKSVSDLMANSRRYQEWIKEGEQKFRECAFVPKEAQGERKFGDSWAAGNEAVRALQTTGRGANPAPNNSDQPPNEYGLPPNRNSFNGEEIAVFALEYGKKINGGKKLRGTSRTTILEKLKRFDKRKNKERKNQTYQFSPEEVIEFLASEIFTR